MSVAGDAVEEISFGRDAAYLREQYFKWWLFRSGWRRWLWLGSVGLAVMAGLVVWLWKTPGAGVVMGVMVGMALAQSALPWLEFRHWKRMALGGLQRMPDLCLSVTAGVLWFGAGPSVRYRADGEVVRVMGGWFVYEQGRQGRHLYVPDRWRRDPRAQPVWTAWQRAAEVEF